MEYQEIVEYMISFWFQYHQFWLLVFGSAIPIMLVFNMIMKSIKALISTGNQI